MKKNILLIEPFCPWPLFSGGHQAIFNGINAVKDDFNAYVCYELWLAADEEDTLTPQLQAALPNATMLPVIHRAPRRPLWRRAVSKAVGIMKKMYVKPAACPDEFGERMLRRLTPRGEEMYRFVDDAIKRYKIDIVQTEMVERLPMGVALPQGVKTVFVHHELRYVCHELEMARRAPSRYEQVCYSVSKQMEIDMINHYDAVITLSAIDKQKLEQIGVRPPVFASMAIVNTQPTQRLHSDDAHTLTYVGPQYHDPNYKGVMWFLENCWNALKSRDDRYRFKIIGKWEEATRQELTAKYEGVEFAGFVADLDSAILDTIAIVPLTVGSGIRMKILEASTLGVPFVTTSVGVEGLPFTSGEDCFIADTASDFVDSILALRDESLRMRFIANAQRVVLENFSLQALRKNRMEAYNSL